MSNVSIIVVNWNGESLLGNCLASLFQQTYSKREIILVDNGSTDRSVQFVKENFPDVKLVELSENRGFTGGNLEGAKLAAGEFIALVNNDTRADERWLASLVQPMLDDDRIGICGSKLLLDRGDRINSAGIGITTAGVGFDRGYGNDASDYRSLEPVFGSCAAAVLYRRAMLNEIGFFDDDFFLYNEDVDLSFRAQLVGWRCVYVPSAVVYHKMNATARRLSDLHVYHHSRNLEFVWIKNMPVTLMLRFAHHKLIQEFGAFFYLCLRHGKWRPFFRAKRDALRMLPKMLKKRREIQGRRQVSNAYIKGLLTSVFQKEWLVQKVLQFIHG
jgi:GT2 family glycosyltransferase